MTAQHLLAIGTASIAICVAAPASAQPDMAPELTYEEETIIDQPVLSDGQVYAPTTMNVGPDYENVPYPGEYPGQYPDVTMPPPAPYPAPQGYPSGWHQQGYPAQQPHFAGFDRDAWLDECYARIDGVHDRKKKGGIIGGLLGAITGGVVGNRAWKGERLAGTLIGAGVGGLAGLVIGGAIGGSGHDDVDECRLYLDRYMAAYGQPGYGYPAQYTYGYAMMPVPVAMMQVTYAEPQRAVVREYVTEEWVDEPVTDYVPARRVIEPRPVKTQSVKSKPVKLKSVKSVKPVKSIKN